MSLKVTEWGFFEEFETDEFEFDGLPAKVVKPKTKPNGKWALKTE